MDVRTSFLEGLGSRYLWGTIRSGAEAWCPPHCGVHVPPGCYEVARINTSRALAPRASLPAGKTETGDGICAFSASLNSLLFYVIAESRLAGRRPKP